MYQVSQKKTSRGSTRDDVERALADWLDEYSTASGILSAWESHCFAMVLTFLRFGYYERALDQLACVIEPPTPLPAFPLRDLMSLDRLLRALPPGVSDRRRASTVTTGYEEEARSPG